MSYNNRKKSISTFALFVLAGLFFVSMMYEITSDGITAIFEWLPVIEWANLAGDIVVNLIQAVIFTVVATYTGSRYITGAGMGAYRKRQGSLSGSNYSKQRKTSPKRIKSSSMRDKL